MKYVCALLSANTYSFTVQPSNIIMDHFAWLQEGTKKHSFGCQVSLPAGTFPPPPPPTYRPDDY